MSDEMIKGIFALGGGIIGAIIGAIIKGIFDARSRERRELTVWTASSSKLIEMASQVAKRVEIHFDGKKVETLASTEIELANTGTHAIEGLHLEIQIEGNVEVISAEVSKELPSPIENKIEFSGKTVRIDIKYLNPYEEMPLRLLTTGGDFKPTIIYRQQNVFFRKRDRTPKEYWNPISVAIFELIRGNLLMHFYARAVMPPYRRYLDALKPKENKDGEEA